MKLSRELEELGFRLHLGATEVDQDLTEEEIAALESIAKTFKERRTARLERTVDVDE